MQFDKGFLQTGGESIFNAQMSNKESAIFEQKGGGEDGREVPLYGGVSMTELVKKYQLRMRHHMRNFQHEEGLTIGGSSGSIHNRFENLAIPFGMFYDNRVENLNGKAIGIHGLKSDGIISESMFNKMFYSVGKE